MNFWLIQAIGLAGSLIVILAVQFNNRKLILLAQAAACVLWIIHYSLLDAPTAVCTNFISFARSVVFYNNDKKWARSPVWLWLFIALFAANSLLTWEGWRSILPGVAMSLTTAALWTRKAPRMRLFYLINSPFWLGYDLLSGSYSCAAVEVCALVSYIVAICRFDRRKPSAEEDGKCTE